MISTRVVLAIIIPVVSMTFGVYIAMPQHLQQSHAAETVHLFNEAPIATSEGNVYATWWTNKTGNWEVMFRASNDGGATFGDKINLSNTPDADSENAEIFALGDSVFVSWWENSLQNATSESVMRVSNDAGATFGPMMMLGQNGTIGGVE